MPCFIARELGLDKLHDVPDDQVALAINLLFVREQKLAAIRCHRTQIGASPILPSPQDKQRLFLGWERFGRHRGGQEKIAA